MSASETLTILIMGHTNGLNTDKSFYDMLCTKYDGCFKEIPSYPQFNRALRKLKPYCQFVMNVLMRIKLNDESGELIIDSTALPVTKHYGGKLVKWAKKYAGKGKNMHGYYFGWKAHVIINARREIVAFWITPANVHDVNALKNDNFMKNIKGKLLGDKGYIISKKYSDKLAKNDIELITHPRKNMKKKLSSEHVELLKKRGVIEGVFGQVKNFLNPTFTKSRTKEGFLVHAMGAFLAYMFRFFNPDLLPV